MNSVTLRVLHLLMILAVGYQKLAWAGGSFLALIVFIMELNQIAQAETDRDLFPRRVFSSASLDNSLDESRFIDSNENPQFRSEMQEDWLKLQSIEGDHLSQMYRELFPGTNRLNGKELAIDILKNVDLFYFSNSDYMREKGIIAQADKSFGINRIGVTGKFFQLSRIRRLAVLLHEARHFLPSTPSHSICPAPLKDSAGEDARSEFGVLLQGLPACDVNKNGAYVAEIIFLRNLKNNCTTCSDVEKQDASAFAEELAVRITDEQLFARIASDK